MAGRLRRRAPPQVADRAPLAPRKGLRPVTVGLALLIALGPLATALGATLLADAARRETAKIEATLAPVRRSAQRQAAARTLLSDAIARPGPVALLDAVATALPADAALVRAERREDGLIELEVAASDPDALRSALRRVPALAGLRDVRQQEGEGRTLVLLRQAAP